jgi:hypothetical protein
MFWNKKSDKDEVKLSKPIAIPEILQKHLIAEKKVKSELAPLFMAAVRKTETSSRDVRIFDLSDALANKVEVKDYTSLDTHPELILYEGTYDESTRAVKLEEKTKVDYETPIFTEDEIREKIEAMKEPGSTVFIYQAAGPAHGGPLGMGAAVIELNPNYPGKKEKKYNAYNVDIVNMQPAGKGDKLFGSDKAKELAGWIKNGHRPRQYAS